MGNIHPKRLTVFLGGQPVQFDHIFLRDACSCSLCVDPSTGQKLFQTTDIPTVVSARTSLMTPEGNLKIEWEHDVPGYPETHLSEFTEDFLQTRSSLRETVRSRYNDQRTVLWDRQTLRADTQWRTYDEYMTSDKILYETLKHLVRYGIVFIKDVPDSEESVEKLGTRIGSLMDTFYGRTWDVRSKPDAKNIAYTNRALGPHMDLLYFSSPPGLQLLHCLRNTAQGGSSTFADSFRAATQIRLDSATFFISLCKFPVTYHYRNDSQHYHFTRPTVELEKHSYLKNHRIAHVNWSPPFQAPFEVDTARDQKASQFRGYLAAAKFMASLLQAPSAQYEMTLESGQCVIFNNRRVVHGRKAFELNGGDRWLKGAYVSSDAYYSRLRVLSEEFKGLNREDGGDEYI